MPRGGKRRPRSRMETLLMVIINITSIISYKIGLKKVILRYMRLGVGGCNHPIIRDGDAGVGLILFPLFYYWCIP